MQWLIDIIIEAIGIPPVYVYRGDPLGPDFTLANLTIDTNWRELDLSGIVDENASAVDISIIARTAAVEEVFMMRKQGQTNTMNVSQMYTRVGSIWHSAGFVVPIGSSGIVEYFGSAGAWQTILVVIKGWWL